MAEFRLVAAKKMKEAAKASEAVALAEIKAISGIEKKKSENVSLSFDEYTSLVTKASKAEHAMKDRVGEAMQEVDKAHISKGEILHKVAEAREEVKMSKKALEDVLARVEETNKGKLAVEEALRKWGSEHGDKRRLFHNSSKFKALHPSSHRRDTILSDPNPIVYDQLKPVLKPTLSIGQILSRKLLLTEEYENMLKSEEHNGEHKVSLARMLSRQEKSSAENSGEIKLLPVKRKKFGLSMITLLITKQSKKKKEQSAPILRSNT